MSPASTAPSSNQWLIVGKTAVKKWILIKTLFKNNEWKLNCDEEEITDLGSSWMKVKRKIIILLWKCWGSQEIVDKTPWVYNSCTQTAICIFTAKYKILKFYSNGHLFLHSEMQNFKTVPRMAFSLFHNETRNLKTAPKMPFVFFTTKYGILKFYPNVYSFFPQGSTKSNSLSSIKFRFLKRKKN